MPGAQNELHTVRVPIEATLERPRGTVRIHTADGHWISRLGEKSPVAMKRRLGA
jgi:hypothetical protein